MWRRQHRPVRRSGALESRERRLRVAEHLTLAARTERIRCSVSLPPVHGAGVRHGRGVGQRDEDLRQRGLARHGGNVRLDAGSGVLGWGDVPAVRAGAANGLHPLRSGDELSHRSGDCFTLTPCPFPVQMRNGPTAQKRSLLAGPAIPTADLAAPLACTLAPVLRRCYHAASRRGNTALRGEGLSTLLRAKPSKDGDAELRDYGDASR